MKELKNKVYELEGLLELADLRPEKFAALKPLIDRRLEEIQALWRDKPEEEPTEEAPAEEEPAEEAPAVEEPTEEQAAEEEQTEEEPMEEEPEEAPLYLRHEEDEPERKPEVSAPAAKRIALCLNDRFRFTRLLGMGDKAEFERRLSRLANAGDFETARDYITDECCLDPDDGDVADLIEIVRTYYDQ